MRCILDASTKYCSYLLCFSPPPACTLAVCHRFLAFVFFVCMPSHDGSSDSWCLIKAFLPHLLYYSAAFHPVCVQAVVHACSCVCTRACLHRQAAWTGSHKSGLFMAPSVLSLSLSLWNISAAESLVEETCHSILCCSCWLAVTHAATSGAHLV